MYRSSIFSFDTLRIGTVPREWFWSILVALALIAAGEVLARILMAPLGDQVWAYWHDDAIDKFEWYRHQLDLGEVPTLLVVGDSTGARNFDPRAFCRASGGVNAYNLAWPANFPLALRASTFPLLEAYQVPPYVLLMQSPSSYISRPRVERFERAVLSSVIGRRAAGETVPADYLYLTRLNLARSLLARYWLEGGAVVRPPREAGFMALERTGKTARAPETSPVQRGTEVAPSFSDQRRATVSELAAIVSKAASRFIVVIPPVLVRPLPFHFAAHREWLDRLAREQGFSVWDLAHVPGLESELFWDELHLWRAGAERFSTILGERFRDEFF